MNLDSASYKVEDGEGLRRVMHVQVPATVLQQEFLARLGALRRRTRIRGFRPGKAPIKLIRQRYGQDVWNELTRETIERSFREGAQNRKLRVVGGGEVKTSKAREGADLEYEATFDVLPDIEFNRLDELAYEEPQVEISERDVDRTIERLRRRDAKWEDVDRPAREGDRMVANIRASRRRQTLDAGDIKEAPLMLGETRLMPQLEERLVGLFASRKKKFRLKMPADYPDETLRGKRVLYEVEVVSLSEPTLPDLDEEFIGKLGVESGSVEELRSNVRATLERELQSVCADHKRQALFDQLLTANPGLTPRTLVDQEVEQARAAMRPPPPPPDPDGEQEAEEPPELPEELPGMRAAAEQRVRLQLLINELAAREEIAPDDQKLREQLQVLAAGAPDPEAAFAELAGNRELVGNLRARMREEQVLEWLYENAAVTPRPMAFDEFMEPMPPVLSGGTAR